MPSGRKDGRRGIEMSKEMSVNMNICPLAWQNVLNSPTVKPVTKLEPGVSW